MSKLGLRWPFLGTKRTSAEHVSHTIHSAEEICEKNFAGGLDVSRGFCIIRNGSGDSQIRPTDQGIHGRVCKAITRS